MCWEDFYSHFDRIYLCKMPPGTEGGEMLEASAAGEWSLNAGSAGGCSNHASFSENPQFRLIVPAQTNLHVRLFQWSTAVESPSRWRVGTAAPNHIGMYIVKMSCEAQTQVALTRLPPVTDSDEGGRRRGRDEGESACRVVAKTRVFTNVWQNAIKLRPGIELERSKGRAAGKGTGEEADFYVIVPCTYEPFCEGRFSLQVISTQPEVPCVLQPITQRPSKAEIAGRWTVDCAGGCCNHPTWMRNPIFLLDLPHTSRHQYPQPTLTLSVGEAGTSVGLGMYVFPYLGSGLENNLSRAQIVAETSPFMKGLTCLCWRGGRELSLCVSV